MKAVNTEVLCVKVLRSEICAADYQGLLSEFARLFDDKDHTAFSLEWINERIYTRALPLTELPTDKPTMFELNDQCDRRTRLMQKLHDEPKETK